MKQSKLFIPTLREIPSDAETLSQSRLYSASGSRHLHVFAFSPAGVGEN